jgi:hypothetical protein
MTISDISSLASSVAVIATLVFLVIQTRQTNRNQRSLMQQGRSERNLQVLIAMTGKDISDVITRAERADLSLTPGQVQSYLRLCGALFWHYEDSYLQFQAGTLDSESWTIDAQSLKVIMSFRSVRAAWRFVRQFSSGKYRTYVDRLLSETGEATPFDYSKVWVALLSERHGEEPLPQASA